MRLIGHARTNAGEYVSEWLLEGTILRAQSKAFGDIYDLTLIKTPNVELADISDNLEAEMMSAVNRLYVQALVLASHRLGLDDPLQEAVVIERMALEKMWLQQAQWRDNRPYDNTATSLKPLKA